MKISARSTISIMLCLCLHRPISAQMGVEPTHVLPAPGQIPPLPPRLPEGIPAFPGAWGGGMFATGGRGGRVIEVTDLNDSGPGSFRAAAEAEGPRIMMFRVAGIIRLESNIDIDNPDITIAGQSAPGDGICLANHSLNINTENVILRHLRVRRGRPGGGRVPTTSGAIPSAGLSWTIAAPVGAWMKTCLFIVT